MTGPPFPRKKRLLRKRVRLPQDIAYYHAMNTPLAAPGTRNDPNQGSLAIIGMGMTLRVRLAALDKLEQEASLA